MSRKKQIKKENLNSPPSMLVPMADVEERERQHRRNLEDAVVSSVNWQWRQFALNIMNGMQKYEAYAKAYGIDDVETNERSYKVAAACSARLLKKASFRKLYRELLEEQGFSDDIADTRLLQVLTDPSAAYKDVLRAVELFKKLNGKLVERSDITSKGKRIITQPKVISTIQPRKQEKE